MKYSTNKSVGKSSVSWVGKQCDPQVARSFKMRPALFYSKCYYGALTLKVGNYVLVSNVDSPEPDSVSGSDIARIEHMYETLADDPKADTCRAIVQWFSRPTALPSKIINSENYIFDVNHEIIEDSRFNPDIAIETINGLCRVEIVDPGIVVSDVVKRIVSKFPVFVARYKLLHVHGSKKMKLEALKFVEQKSPPHRRESMLDKTNRLSMSSVNDTPKTSKRKHNRLKSIEFIDMHQFDKHEITTSQQCLEQQEWVIKTVIDAGNNNYKNKLDRLTEGICGVVISDDEKVSPSKIAKVYNANRKSQSIRKNLNASFQCDSPASSDGEMLNYSIVKDSSNNTPVTKIKLRLSERQKPVVDTPRRSARKRSTCHEENVMDNETSPRKNKKSISNDDEITKTPPLRQRRKSILKTPSYKVDAAGTPKRNIQLSNIVEEFANGRRISKRIDTTPTKIGSIKGLPEQESSRGRSPIIDASKSTPKSSTKLKLIRSGAIQPTIHYRDSPVEGPLDDHLALVRERLHVSVIPKCLPCREKEYDEIYSFLEGKIIESCGGCMYISGVPGTGKTATTSAVIRALQSQAEEEEIPKFEFVEINGMRLTEPRQAYVHIYRQLTGKTLAWEQAYNLLDKRFTTKSPRRITTILLVDELDILCNKRQDVVYNLLNWPTAATAHLVVITIANTMDLPERLLMGKISSRLGLTRLTFQPYNFRQLQEIVMARLTGMSSFDSDAIQLVARKVAAVSGDARRALDICRRATELADDHSKKSGQRVSVSMVFVQQALGEMISSAKVQTIRSCSRVEQLFLQAVTAEVARTGIEECIFIRVYSQFESLAAFAGITVPNPGRAISICSRLGTSRLLICESSRNDIYQKILLNISSDDVYYALQASNLI
ncbi:origin recognition complex subunit 1 [Wyeomyia smithii]|uniref:origin recognition complex subunit 1 n=1 Tax=Wyeomyia smithii TaxID=174621 RepID=UPI002467FC42|nr:origin recognition complex subunit 1 [Wyeomyia smithii]